MAKLIKLIHPYEIESIKTLNDFLIILKNMLRLSSKKILEKKDGILMPVRWSSLKACWVVDRGTDLYRDIEGITAENIDRYFKSSEPIYNGILFALNTVQNKTLDSLFESFNLKKNQNKFFAFEYCNSITNIVNNEKECMYPLGLFQRCQTKKRSGLHSKNHKSILIDNSIKTLNKVSSCSKKISDLSFYSVKNYYTSFETFLNQIKSKTYEFILKKTTKQLNPKDFLNASLCKKTTNKEILHFLDNPSVYSENSFNKIKINVILYLVYFDFVRFIKNHLKINSNNFEGFVIPDDQNNIYYKATGEFVLKVFKKTKKLSNVNLLPPILPGIF